MLKWLAIMARMGRSALRSRRELALENLGLRQQVAVFKHRHPRPQLTAVERWFWVLLSRVWPNWRASLGIVQAETVVRWHRQGFHHYWQQEKPRARTN